LDILDFGSFATRNRECTSLLRRSARQLEELPLFGDIIFWTGDRPPVALTEQHLAMCYDPQLKNETIPVPDFGIQAWPEIGVDDYESFIIRLRSMAEELPAINRIGWRGNTQGIVTRERFVTIAANHPNLFDVQAAQVLQSYSDPHYLTMSTQVQRWSALADVEGVGYSGRLKFLISSGRPTLVVERPYVEWWHHYLPKTIVDLAVQRDLTDLVPKAKTILNIDRQGSWLADIEDFSLTYLTRTAGIKRWQDVLTSLSTLARPGASSAAQLFMWCGPRQSED